MTYIQGVLPGFELLMLGDFSHHDDRDLTDEEMDEAQAELIAEPVENDDPYEFADY